MPDTSSSPTHPWTAAAPCRVAPQEVRTGRRRPRIEFEEDFLMQSYHDRHPEVGLGARWRPWRYPVARWASHCHDNLSGHAAPEQQASRASCVCVHGLMTTQLLQFVSRHGKASVSSGRRRRALRHAFCSVPIPVDLSRAAKAVPRAPCSQSSCPALRPSCEPSTCWLHCTWSCQFHAQRPACSPPVQHVLHPITINSFEPAPIRAFARRQLELMRKHGLSKKEAREHLEQEFEQ